MKKDRHRVATLDLEEGTAYIYTKTGEELLATPVTRSKASEAQIVMDWSAKGELVGIEVLFTPVIGGVPVGLKDE